MHTSVLALRVCWGTYLASKGSGTRSSLVHFVIKEASDAGERPGLLMAAHFAMKEASDTDERVELLVAAAAALNLHGCASPSVSSREARARARTSVGMHLKCICLRPPWRLTGNASRPGRRRNDARGRAPRGSRCPGKYT